MGILGPSLLSLMMILLSGCQLGYYAASAYNQLLLLNSRIPIETALKDENISEQDKHKLRLCLVARKFVDEQMHLKVTGNYKTFVRLDRPYVTYVVSAAPKWELKHYEWNYPIVGSMPYKGFFNEADAIEEEADLRRKNLDTYLRGVSAYSTLGWFNDPILSSMLRYDDYDLVNTIVHESTHATLYIKNSADFNERFATFMGNLGAEMFFKNLEGPNSPILERARLEREEQRNFSTFISGQIRSLEQWYNSHPEQSEDSRQKRFQQISDQFNRELKPKLKLHSYGRFEKADLNNAYILLYKTYEQDLSDFSRLYEHLGGNLANFIEAVRSLESDPRPEDKLKSLFN